MCELCKHDTASWHGDTENHTEFYFYITRYLQQASYSGSIYEVELLKIWMEMHCRQIYVYIHSACFFAESFYFPQIF